MVLDGSESRWRADNNNKLYGIATSPNALPNSSASAIALGLTNYFIPQGLTYTRNHEGYFALYGGDITITFWLNDLDKTLEDFKTWMGSHITTLYYVLAAPTEEEITAPGLIAQLNALYQAM